MEIDQEKAMYQVFFSENEEILYQNVFCEKTDREEMEVEEEKAKETRKHHRTDVIKTQPNSVVQNL